MTATGPARADGVTAAAAGPVAVRVVLPAHLRTLAGTTDREISLAASPPPTIGSLLDALEARYPVLRGTVRDPVSGRRRPFVRFFACEEDLSHDPWETLLPDDVLSGREPFIVLGAIAGG